MKRSFPPAQYSVGSVRFSAPGSARFRSFETCHEFVCGPFAQGLSSVRQASVRASLRPTLCSHLPSGHLAGNATRRLGDAFTLVELLVVVAVIAVLAALGIMTLGGANTRGAEARARTEVAALSAAIESFKVDQGFFPTNHESLYKSLCPTQAGAKVYFEPRPGMLATNLPVTNELGNMVMEVQFVDPWDNPYGYTNATNYFELWSTAGKTNLADSNNWIRN